MDRSFLSDFDVVAASRSFVCIRLATYEDKSEAEFLKLIYLGRSGNLENTTFAILSPDGKKKLAAAGRGPFHEFRNAAQMAAGMKRIAARYPNTKKAVFTDTRLPEMRNAELALNVASADNLPLVVAVAEDKSTLIKIKSKLVRVAWSEKHAGQFGFASVSNFKDLKPFTGARPTAGVLVIQPGQFGLSGKTMAQFEADVEPSDIELTLTKIAANFPRVTKAHDSHVRLGIELGIQWETEIPETDPQALRAKARARGSR